MRMQSHHDKYLKSELKSLVPTLAVTDPGSGRAFGKKLSIPETIPRKCKNRTSEKLQNSGNTTLPEINTVNGMHKNLTADKHINIRKSFDDKSDRLRISKPSDQNDVDAMKTIITNYLAIDSKTEADIESSKCKTTEKGMNSRNKQIKLKMQNNKSAEQRKSNFNYSKNDNCNRKQSSHSNYPVS